MKASDPAELNRALPLYTNVKAVSFATDPDGICNLTLALWQCSGPGPISLQLSCSGVAGLMLRDFGSGLTQVQCLQCADVSAHQHEHVNFEFTDLENGVLAFRCRSFTWAVTPS